MIRPFARLAILTALAASLGCSGDKGVAGVLVVAMVDVTPGISTVVVGGTRQLSAEPKTSSGISVPGRAVTWSSLRPSVATVSSTGLVTAQAVGGPVTIRATVDGVAGDALVTVSAVPVNSVTVSPGSNPLVAGQSVQLTAAAFDAGGAPLSGRSFLWQSSDPNVAAVTTTGMVLAVAAGGPVTITATSEGKSGTATVTVASRPADRLAFAQQPTTTAAGAPFNPSIKVAVQDNVLATVVSATNPVTIELAANPGGATLSGTTTVNAVNGVATFGNLTLNRVGAGYTFLVTSPGLLSATSAPFNVTAGGASRLVLTTAPPATAQSGVPLAPQPVVQLVDVGGNNVPQAGVVVTATIPPGAGTLGGTVTATTNASGAAVFTNLAISGPPGSYTLSFGSPGLTSVSSGPIVLGAGPAALLTITAQPSSTAQSGSPLAQQPAIQVRDAAGNPVSLAGRVVTAELASGTGILAGSTTATTNANGLATFASLTINGNAGVYTLRFTSPGLVPVVSSSITLGAGAPSQITITTQPSPTAQVGVAFPQQPSVQLRDASGNPAAFVGVNITATASGGGTTQGTTTAATNTSGLATFSGLALSGAVGSYTITFSSPGLTSAISSPIALSAGPAAQLGITTQPSASTSSGAVLPQQPVVQVLDAAGNTVAAAGVTVAAALASGPGTGVLGGTLSVATSGTGAATYTNLKITGPSGAYTLRFSAPGLTPVVSSTVTLGAGTATTIAANSVTSQSAPAGGAAVAPSVKVTDGSGNPVAGVPVTFAVTLGGGTVVPTTAVLTNASGIATATSWTLGPAAGTNNNRVTATSAGLSGNPVTFTASATAGPAFQIAANSVTAQSAPVGADVSNPPSVIVTDQFGNPVGGFAVSFAVTAGGGTVVPAAPATVTTNPLGVAATTKWTLGPGVGTNTVQATGAGLSGSPVTFNATGTAGSATNIAANSATSLSGVAGANVTPAPSVKVTDGTGNPVQGVVVTFAVTTGGGSISGPAAVATDAAGVATVGGWTLGPAAGTNNNTLSASAGTLIGSPVNFVASGTAGPPALITALSSTSQSATVGTTVTPPSVKVTDINGNPISGFAVTFTLTSPAPPGSISPASPATINTNVSGIATLTSWTLSNTAGVNSVAATGSGLGPTTFNATGTAGTAASAVANSPTSQTAPIGSTVTAPSVLVTDGFGNPVSGFGVTFTLSGAGGSISPASPATVSTNASGVASLTSWTLGGVAGTNNYTVTAAPGALTPVVFTASATPGPAANIAAVSSTSQNGTVGTTVTPPKVIVTDAGGNPIAGVSVTFTLASPGSSGLISPASPATISTDIAGLATLTTWTLGTTAGVNTVTATSGTLSGSPVTFTATGTAGAATTIVANSVTSQSGTVATDVAVPPSVLVTDTHGNPVSGAVVNFVVTNAANGGTVNSASAATVMTNPSGVATLTNWTLGNDAGIDNNVVEARSTGLSGSPVIFKASGVAGAATQIIITTQPGAPATPAPAAFSPQPVVRVLDALNNPVAGVSVTVSLDPSGTGTGSLSGTVTVVTDVTGHGTYTNLGVTFAGDYVLKFTALSTLTVLSSHVLFL